MADAVLYTTLEQEGVADELLYQKVITYLSAHFREDISLKSVARSFGYNENYTSQTNIKNIAKLPINPNFAMLADNGNIENIEGNYLDNIVEAILSI